MRPVVLKFGGASLATPARVRRAARRAFEWRRAGHAPVVVVSACGRTTDRILRWLEGVAGARSSRETDRALVTGEDLAASLVAAALAARGVPARALPGGEAGLRGEGRHGAGRVRRVAPGPLRELLRDGVVPVVAGFQALRADGETVTLGRGTSDLTAVHLAAALGAPACHLVKDVSGVYDRDPAVDPDARLLRRLDAVALGELSSDWAGIVHPDATRLAAERDVVLRIYGFRDPVFGDHGTTVHPGPPSDLPAAAGAPLELRRRVVG